jgi:hypothetical protein
MRYSDFSQSSTIKYSTQTDELSERIQSTMQPGQPGCNDLEDHVRSRADDLMRRAFAPVWKDIFTNIEDVL